MGLGYSVLMGLLLLGVAVLILYGVRSAVSRRREAGEKLANLAAALEAERQRGTLSGERDGLAYSLYFREKGRHHPPSLKITVPSELPVALTITPETSFDRLAKWLGLSAEIQTGDPDFDRCCYVVCERPDWAAAYLGKADHRRAVMALMRRKPKSVELGPDGMQVLFSPLSWSKKVDVAFITDLLDRLAELGREVPEVEEISSHPLFRRQTKDKKKLAARLALIPLVWGAPGAGLWWIGSKLYPPVRNVLYLDGLQIGLVLVLAYTAYAFLNLRGRSTSHREIGLAFILALFAFTSAAIGVMVVGNGLLDGGSSSEYLVPVLDKHFSRSDRGNLTCYVTLEHWDPEQPAFEMRVSDTVYPHLAAGKRMRIIIKPGCLGYAWIRDYELASPPPG